MTDWLLPGAARDTQTITAEWTPSSMPLIDGVQIREVRHVVKATGHLTEIFRADWCLDDRPVDQVFQVELQPGAISAWHAHDATLDRLFVTEGLGRIVLYDRRRSSPTQGLVNELRVSARRPMLVVIPPRVWHGMQNTGDAPMRVLNIVDRAYDYRSPDHWRVPHDSAEIPYRFTGERPLPRTGEP
jgi:dTDP-4-dehydrorhamnose 3,5-epimerase